MTKYARDEFDRVPEASSRQGVHRVVAESRRRQSPALILAVGAAVLVVGLVAFLLLPKLGFAPAGRTLAATGEPAVSSPTAPAPAASSDAPAASEAPSTRAPTAAAPPDGAVDKTQPVAVFNGTSTAGLATRVGATVSTDGWTLGTLGIWGGVPQQDSVIFYSGAAQRGNAEALGELLGIPSVVDSAEFQEPLVIVLAQGFQ